MNSFVSECILAEKKLNMLSNVEKSSSNSNTSTFSKNITNVNQTIIYPSSERRLSLTKSYNCSKTISSNLNENILFIVPKQFVELISQNSNIHERKCSPVVIDCRSQIDFGCERIHSSFNINCRAKLIARKLGSKRLEDIEPNLSLSLNNSDIVILYDQSTDIRSEEKLRLSPLNLVVQAAKKSNKKIYIIQGGFDAIKTQYPHLIECAVEAPRDKYEQDHLPSTPDTVDKENFTMTEILPHIFVGNVHDAQNVDRLNEKGITHIINSTPDLPCCWDKQYKYIRVDVLDLPSQNIRKHFDKAIEFIDEALYKKTNNVLVHCSAGISRSPTLVLAYMIKKYHMTLEEAFNKMRQLRQIVDPNVSFIIQLRDWETKCLSKTTTGETADDNINHACINARPNTYCGSTSKQKTDTKKRIESAIIVN
ncbi:unnamed protein product [Adineta steineri]|uniref:protein-tyrosine-phosphatase n=1 Tax=Adineta steineri TaxID=433720 RepID=A0A819D272_9BILA|nr:unnamed protein product [Adineta steineri]CAF3830951.1 unnamed protein product [Adineta steineri]